MLLITRHECINMAQVERPCAHNLKTQGLWTPDCGLPVVLARTTQKWPEAAAAACCNYALRFIMATIAATKGNAGNLRLNQRVTTTKAAAQKAKENHFNYD